MTCKHDNTDMICSMCDAESIAEGKRILRQRALELYTPPFRVDHGYVFDANSHMVADGLLRVRGWGRISYFNDPESLQDAVADLIVEALNKVWTNNREGKQ